MAASPPVFAPADPTPRQPRTTAPGAEVVNLAANPSLSEMELVSRIRILFSHARAQRKAYVQQWVKNHRVVRNRTWLATRPDWMPSPEVPEIRPIIGSCVAWVTDQRPEFDLMPSAQPYSPFAQFFEGLAMDMKTAINANWQTYLREAELAKIVWDAYQYDIGIAKTVWNPALADGLGDADFRRVDPFTWYWDPQSSCMADANYFIEARTISLQELDRRFPGAAASFDVQGYVENVDQMPNIRVGTGQMPRANPGAIAPATTARYGLPGQSRDRAAKDDSGVTLLEAWLREHIVIPGPNGDKRVFDSWRCVCVAGPHVLMNKRANELLPFNTHPYEKYTPEDMGEMCGQSMVELLAPSQISINRLLASMQQNIDLVGNPVWKESTRSGLQRQKMTNKPGTRVTVASGDAESGWVNPPQLQALMPQLVSFFITEMERISGLSAIARGMTPGGRVASDVMDSVMESGFVRIRMSQRSLEWMLRGVAQKLIAIIAEFYTEPRFLSMVGPDGEKTALTLRARHFYVPNDQDAVPLRFQIQVRAGSMSATSRNARISEIDTLFAMGAVDRPVVLEAHEIPNREAILSRIADAEAKGTFAPPGARQRAH